MPKHPVVTKDYPENLVDGIMICGINFGYSEADERLEKAGLARPVEPPSFFSDEQVNSTQFRNTILRWLSSWNLELIPKAGQEGMLERSFIQTNWLGTQSRSISSGAKITPSLLVQEADGILDLIEERKPSVIIFFGYPLIEAFNDMQLRSRVTEILGDRSGDPKAYRGDPPNYVGTKFEMFAQRYGETQIICLPHPRTPISAEYIASLKPPVHIVKRILEKSCVD